MNGLFEKSLIKFYFIVIKSSSKAESILNQTILDSPVFLIQHSNLDTLVDFFPCLVGDDYGPDLEHDDSNDVNHTKNDSGS